MAKEKQVFFCKECGYESAKWVGQCPGCRAWNTFVEETISVGAGRHANVKKDAVAPTSILEVTTANESRIKTGISELDRVLGGGIVEGSLVLVGGDPGIGKSTILLQMCRNLVQGSGTEVLYVSGEESLAQIKMRAERIGSFTKDMKLLCDNDMDNISAAIQKSKASVVIIDSIQTVLASEIGSAPGTVTQVREVTARLMQLAKQNNIAIFIVGHVTKEGTVAGPRTLEHMVDSVLYFEGDRNNGFRVLRGVKNRFGSTNEIGVFTMTDKGLCEVQNPSQLMLNGRPEGVPGSVVVSSIEGTRSILVELQALVCQTNFNMPRRTSVGVDYNRVNLITAVMEKRVGMNLWGFDAYVSIAGGMKINDPAIDLGIAFAIASSMNNKPVGDDVMIIGEIGLAGEIRGVTNIMQRVKEADKLGFRKCIMPKSNYDKEMEKLGIEICCVSNLAQAIEGM
ncbi:MAG: DNA repair protein RadA [Clostridium sp.]|nr:DNA repair protein RadA [Clostridium sp.]MCM1400108.1 DNA repair protein RadA [Clostridium sp.]MCM1460795.1 DNA repair protein RadA [Bacteroides sp.]